MQVSLEAGDGLFLIKVGHDEEFNRYDPGVQLHFAAIDYFHTKRAHDALPSARFRGTTFSSVCTRNGAGR